MTHESCEDIIEDRQTKEPVIVHSMAERTPFGMYNKIEYAFRNPKDLEAFAKTMANGSGENTSTIRLTIETYKLNEVWDV